MGQFSVEGKRVVVVGAARSGLAAAELLVARGARVIVTDARPGIEVADRLRGLGVALELGEHRPRTLAEADLVVLSPGVPPDEPAVAAARRTGVPIIGEIELASRWLSGRVVAVTGTKGKSTTTVLAGRMLEAAGVPVTTGGNLGTALSSQVAASRPDVVHLIEVSSFQLELTEQFHPWVAVFLNLSADHLDRHGSMERYVDAKSRIFANQRSEDWAVVNADDPHVLALARRGLARIRLFGLGSVVDGVTVAFDSIVRRTPESDLPLVPVSTVRLIGSHLLSDVMAAAAVADIVGVPPPVMARAVGAFTGLEHALEPVMEICGVRFVNDSKATNVEAARHAVESFDGQVIAIVGGIFKGGDLRVLGPGLARRRGAVVAIGAARGLVRGALGDTVPVHDADSMGLAVRRAFALASPGGTVVLAPACASFDQFESYADRGRAFKEEVARLGREQQSEHEQ